MFWRYNCPWDAFNKFVIVYYKTLGTAFAAIFKHLIYLETSVFLCNRYGKLVRMGLKMHRVSLAAGKTLVWPISSQNLIHTDFDLE